MNAIINKLLSAPYKSMPKMDLKRPGFTYSSCKTSSKNKERVKKFEETGCSRYIYQNKLDKIFQHYMAYGSFKNLNREAAADKVLRDKAFNIANNWNHDG